MDPEDVIQLGKMLNEISYGCIYKGLSKNGGDAVAVKVIELSDLDKVDELRWEISLLTEWESPNVIQYFGSCVNGSELWIILEFAAGSVADLMKPGPIEETHAAVIVREVCKGLEFLHQKGIAHGDVRAASILMSSDGNVKLGEYGVGRVLEVRRSTYMGIPYWMSPESIAENDIGIKGDIWSLGITCIELLTGQPPHANKHPMRAYFLILKSDPPFLEGSFSRWFKRFVDLCLRKDKLERPTAKALLKDKLFRNTKETNILVELVERWKERREVDDFERDFDSPNPGVPMKVKAQLQRGFREPRAGELFALVVYFSDGYLKLLHEDKAQAKESFPKSQRFFSLAAQLSMDLQMVLCSRVFGLGDSVIKRRHSERGFQRYVR